MSDVVIQFPRSLRGHPAETRASAFQIVAGRARQLLGRIATRCGVPGLVQNMEVTDQVTGHKVSISVGELYVRLSIDGRDYYFDRLTGRFDGSGTSVG